MNPCYPRLQQRMLSFISKFAIVFCCFLFLSANNILFAQVVLTTDQEDYPPGGTVILTGSGFQPDESVIVQVLHHEENGDNSESNAHQPWTVTADGNGNFVTTWNVPADEDELNATLLAIADGQSSGLHAEVTFTDANWSIGPTYNNLCGGVETELTFTITQTGTSVSSNFQNGRFRLVFPGAGTVSSGSIISVSGSKNWTLTLLAGNDVCLRAATSADALANTQTIVFKLMVTPPNSLGQTQLNGVSAAFGANCPSAGTTADIPLRILRVSTLSPVFTQCPSNIAVNTDPGLCSAVVNYTSEASGTNVALTYAFSGATTGSGSGTGSGAAFNKGITHVTVTASNSCAVKTCDFDITVTDNEPPHITCPADVILSACETAAWSLPLADDNCPGVTIQQISGPAPGSTIANGTTAIVSYTATDASGNQTSCSFNVSRKEALVATCSNTNPQLYFGYAGDQTSTIKVVASGGTGPYTVSFSMNRALKCNAITSAGDELWIGGTGTTSSTGTTCPASGDGIVPISEARGVTTNYTVKVTLMEDADITATVTDADGCVTTCTTHIDAEDVRCFAGNSGISKVTICHKTGSAKNPCVTICVDESAVEEHLAHGDFLGTCTADCTAPAALMGNISMLSKDANALAGKLQAKVFPNPTSTSFKLSLVSNSREEVKITVMNLYGNIVFQAKGSVDEQYSFGEGFASGTYIVRILQGKQIQTLKVTKGKG